MTSHDATDAFATPACPPGVCGTVQNSCGQEVDCGGCSGTTPICVGNTCQACTGSPACPSDCCNAVSGTCGPCPSGQTCGGGDPGTPNVCGCTPVEPGDTGVCGTVQNNCGLGVDCGPCECDPLCSACQQCDTETGQCVPEAGQAGLVAYDDALQVPRGTNCRSVTLSGCDPQGQPLTFEVVNPPSQGGLTEFNPPQSTPTSQTLCYQSNDLFFTGHVSFTYQAINPMGQRSNIALIEIEVFEV